MPQGLFPPRRNPSINFDWTDVAGAIGFIVYDGVNAIDSTGDNYTLIDSAYSATLTPVDGTVTNSDEIVTDAAGTGAGGAATKAIDVDFDLTEYQLPRNLKGTALVRVSVVGDTNAQTDNTYVIAKLRKWTGAAETEIASTQSPTEQLLVDEERGFLIPITVPLTHFKKGETLRLTIEVWTETTPNHVGLAHNPNDSAIATTAANRSAFSAGNSRLTVAIPYRIDFM